MEKYLVKKKTVYMIATLDIPTNYLRVQPKAFGGQYKFYKNIEKGTKVSSENDALWLIEEYKQITNDKSLELVAVPVEISYRLLNYSSTKSKEFDLFSASKDTVSSLAQIKEGNKNG